MIRIETNARQVVRRIRQLLGLIIPQIALKELNETVVRIQTRMQEPGKPIRYPVHWDSEKQRRAYFATDGFGEGIPYRRTYKRPNAWQRRLISNGVELANREKGAVYLYGRADGQDLSPGKKQSNIHKGRWPLFRPVVDEEIQTLHKNLIARIRIETQ